MKLTSITALFSRGRDTSKYTPLPTTYTSPISASRNTSSEQQSPSQPTMHEEKDPGLRTLSAISKSRLDPRIVSDATIGLSDGLTVPFALTAGLSALGDARLAVCAGLAELVAGALIMGLGGYLGTASESRAYRAAVSEMRRSIEEEEPAGTRELVRSTFDGCGFSDEVLEAMATQLSASSRDNVEAFLVRFHHRQLPVSSNSPARAYVSTLTIALGYFLGGLTPLTPYFLFETNQTAFLWSIAVMTVALFVFGYVKTLLVGEGEKVACLKGGVQMMVLGGIAAGSAMGCVKAIAP